MKLSEELQWRGFVALNTLDQISDLDKAPRNSIGAPTHPQIASISAILPP